MITMTFEELKSELLNRAKILEICPAFQKVLISANRLELLAAAVDIIEWSYLSGVVDNDLLDQFTEEELNSVNVFFSNFINENPGEGPLYFLGSGVHEITLNANNSCIVKVLGSCDLTCILSDNAFVDIKSYGTATVSVSLDDNSTAKVECTQDSNINFTGYADTVGQIVASDNSEINYSGHGNSYCIIKAYNYSSVTYLNSDDSISQIDTYNSATKQEGDGL